MNWGSYALSALNYAIAGCLITELIIFNLSSSGLPLFWNLLLVSTTVLIFTITPFCDYRLDILDKKEAKSP